MEVMLPNPHDLVNERREKTVASMMKGCIQLQVFALCHQNHGHRLGLFKVIFRPIAYLRLFETMISFFFFSPQDVLTGRASPCLRRPSLDNSLVPQKRIDRCRIRYPVLSRSTREVSRCLWL